MIDVRKVKLECVRPNGRYVDLTNHTMFNLSDEDIMALRRYYRDPNIAYERRIILNNQGYNSAGNNVPSRKQPSVRYAKATSDGTRKTNYKVNRNNTYNNGKHRVKGQIPTINDLKRVVIIIGGVVVLVTGTVFVNNLGNTKGVQVLPPSSSFVEEMQYPEHMSSYEEITTEATQETFGIDQEDIERAEFIRELCNVYHLDYHKTYSILSSITDEFTNPDYLAFHMETVSAKGYPVYAQSEEEMLIYMVRIVSQDPNRFGISEAQIDSSYSSGRDYPQLIYKWATRMNVDPCLIYGIIQTETGWNSKLLNESNNPAGLKLNGDWWEFGTLEEGIIELCVEIFKYRSMGAETIDEMARIHCPVDDPNDYAGNNKGWANLVRQGMEEGRAVFERLGLTQNNGLSH